MDSDVGTAVCQYTDGYRSARIVNVKLPDEVGVPERTPPEVSVNPETLPLMTMNGSGAVPPLAVMV